MPLSQAHVTATTPLGANLVADGATFRVWAPGAEQVYLVLGDTGTYAEDPADLLVRDTLGYWSGFQAGVADGTLYRFFIVGSGQKAFKRDPCARELEAGDYAKRTGIVREPTTYPWHDQSFRPPAARDLVVYQLHVGVFFARDQHDNDLRANRPATFLDAVQRLPYLADLGVNAVQPLPFAEFPTESSLGYNGSDLFSPETDYCVLPGDLGPHLDAVNRLLAGKGQPPLRADQLEREIDQLKAFVDLCHLHGIAVLADVVYNHGGGEPLYRFDLSPDDPYFTQAEGGGGLVFDFGQDAVRGFLIDNALALLGEYHVDGLRCDEVTIIVDHDGSRFCRDLTSTLHYAHPRATLIAEFWHDPAYAVAPADHGGLGFDVSYSDRLRNAIRNLIDASSDGAGAPLDLWPLHDTLPPPPNVPLSRQAYTCVENHDLELDADGDGHRLPRIPRLACSGCERSWFAQSRSRVATGLLLCAPGVPMLFMGQEFLEDKLWSDDPHRHDLLIDWDGLDGPDPAAHQPAMQAFHRFTRDAIWLRRRQPALRDEGLRVYDPDTTNRVQAFERWVPGVGRNVVVVATLSESTLRGYQLGFPLPGPWPEVFNSDAYDPDPAHAVDGNLGSVTAGGPPLHGYAQSATLTIPANGVLVFARDHGD